MGDSTLDKAGTDYWDRNWRDQSLPQPLRHDSKALRDHVDVETFRYLSDTFKAHGIAHQARVVEVGCARSQVLPVLAQQLGVSVSGVDYSAEGCEQAKRILANAGVEGEIYCADVFDLPKELTESHDVVMSFGLVEHFTDTAAVLAALGRLLKPGGLIITTIPNMRGLPGWWQKCLNRSVYDIHVPLTPAELNKASNDAGFETIQCQYFMSTNFGVINIGKRETTKAWWVRKVVLATLVRLSMAVWWLERRTRPLPCSRLLSPSIHCLARRN